jgi:hypothetical protein
MRWTSVSRLLWVACAVLLSWVGHAELAWGQVCRQPDATVEFVRQDLARYVLAAHPDERAVRDSLRLGESRLISVITSESVCKKANPAYQAVLAGTGHGFSGQVYVIQVGTNYAVFDPVYHWGA